MNRRYLKTGFALLALTIVAGALPACTADTVAASGDGGMVPRVASPVIAAPDIGTHQQLPQFGNEGGG